MKLDKSHALAGLIGGVCTASILLVSFGETYGRLNSTVEQLEKRVQKLEQRAMPGTKLGDLCLKLIEAQSAPDSLSSSGTPEQDRIEKQLARLGCYDSVPASMSVSAENAAEPTNSKP